MPEDPRRGCHAVLPVADLIATLFRQLTLETAWTGSIVNDAVVEAWAQKAVTGVAAGATEG
jgi:hypothetical protein